MQPVEKKDPNLFRDPKEFGDKDSKISGIKM
jgi:hypothetical protein